MHKWVFLIISVPALGVIGCSGSTDSDNGAGGTGATGAGGTSGGGAGDAGGSAGSAGGDAGLTGTPCRASYHCLEKQTCVFESCGELGRCVDDFSCPTQAPEPTCTCIGYTADSPCEAKGLGGPLKAGECGTKSCTVNGNTIGSGAQITKDDGCNQCSCVDGELHCTDFACQECDANTPCPTGQFCNFRDQKCGQGVKGVCDLQPQHCYAMEAPSVCGCDGKPYDNFCYAYLAGVSIAEGFDCQL